MYGMCSGLSNWWPCWFRRARQGMCPPLPLLSPSSTPSPTFLAFAAAAAANDGTHVRDASRTRRTMCVPYQPVRSRAHAALRTTPYSVPIPPILPATTTTPRAAPLHPAATPSAVRAARHATPQEATLIISIFPIRSGGRETCNTLPSAPSLHTLPPQSSVLYHPRGLSLLPSSPSR